MSSLAGAKTRFSQSPELIELGFLPHFDHFTCHTVSWELTALSIVIESENVQYCCLAFEHLIII